MPEFTRTAASEIPAAAHPLEAAFWDAFKARSIPGMSVAQVRPFANILAAGPQKSPLLTSLGLALLAARRPAESPYFGADRGERIARWVNALRPMDPPAQPSREDTVAALQAFDEFLLTHTADLNLDRTTMELFTSPLATMFAAQYLRADGQSDGARGGIYFGRSLDRADTVYTREMNSRERRTREFEIERMERRLAEQQREAQLRHEETVVRSRQRDDLTDEIFKAEKLVDTRGHLAKVAAIQQAIENSETRYVQLLARQGAQASESDLSAESNARAMFVRTRVGEVFASWFRDLEQKTLASRAPEDILEARWFLWMFDFPDSREPPGGKTFFATREAEAADAARKSRGRPLAQIANFLLEPLAPRGPTRLVSGFDANLEPRFAPSSAWRQNQVEGLLNDTWFRFGHEPTALREQIFVVVKALHGITESDAITIETLRPWMRRFVALAPKETQRVALSWDGDPQTSKLISRAKE